MRIRPHTLCMLLLSCLLLLSGSWLTPSLPAQVRIPQEALATADLQEILELGNQLENQRRWGEALLHYEEAARRHPGRTELQQRLTLARIHYDLERRRADTSYRELLALSQREALDLYAEILLKIHSHYVDEPDWRKLVDQGILHLQVALGEDRFQQAHLPPAARARAIEFRRELPRRIAALPIYDRHLARDAVSTVVQRAGRELSLSPTPVILEFAAGAAAALDPYSTFLTGAQLDDVFSQIEGNFVGLGIELKVETDSLLIVNVIAAGPAGLAGIQDGQRIVEIGGRSVQELTGETAAEMLKGPENSSVQVTIEDTDGQRRRLWLTRRRVEVPSVDDVRLVDEQLGIGYLRLTSFQKTTIRELDAALWRLHRQGMRFLILDVRGNPGGLLPAAVEVADKFVTSGTLVSTRGRSPREDFDYRAHQTGTWRVPLIVLIDGDSASASEIFAGAIHDHRRGTVVGQRSYGKGSVQGIFPLNVTRAGIRLTTAKFYSPNGQPISRRGVSPDVPVRTAARPIDGQLPTPADDLTLNAAVQLVRQQAGQR